MSNLLDQPWRVFAVSLLALWGCAQLGAALRRKRKAAVESAPEIFSLVLSASLTLLGLIIGFTFSMAVTRYDQRKNYEASEANAIGTEYVRAGFLPPAEAATTRALLRDYLHQRVLLYQTADPARSAQIRQRTEALQTQLWSTVQAAALAQPGPLTALVSAGMNDVLDSQGYTQAAWWNRTPEAAWVLMLVMALVCNAMVGYAARGGPRMLLLAIMPLLLSIAFLLIADIDSPRAGVIRVSPQNLLSITEQLR